MTVSATVTGAVTYQWYLGNASDTSNPIAGATAASFTTTALVLSTNYWVRVADANGTADSYTATVTVNYPPAITAQPITQTVNAGSTVTFSVAVAANPAPTYQWSKSNVAIAGATRAALTLANVQAADAGSYNVTVTNSLGSATSNAGVLTVNPAAPTIIVPPASQIGVAGLNLAFTVTVQGTAPLSYQWRKNSTAISGATNAVLTLNNLQTTDAGSFDVTVSNTMGSATSASATLTVTSVMVYGYSTYAGMARSSGSTDGTGSAARFQEPNGSAVDSAGNVYIADPSANTIRKIAPGGVVTTLAGLAGWSGNADGTGTAARFYGPTGVAVDTAGNVYVADSNNNEIRKITPAGVVSTVAGSPSGGSTDGTGTAARFNGPVSVAVDSSGVLYVADVQNNTIRKITTAGVVTTLAGLAGSYGSTDGTGSAARFDYPEGAAVDASGNVYVADYYNYAIRKITPAGVVTTLAGGSYGTADGTGTAAHFTSPVGIAADAAGTVYVTDQSSDLIRKVTAGGTVTTIGGSPYYSGSSDGVGSNANFYYPSGVAVDQNGILYIADYYNYTVRKGVPAPANPQIATQPQSATIVSGQSATLSVGATGASTLTYQWYQGTASSTTNPIAGATGATYTISSLTTGASYWVRVTNSTGTVDSNTATLTVIVPPTVTTQPQGSTIGSGQTAILSVAATGTAPLSYLWFTGTSGNTASPINNATGTSYTAAALAATTSYWVRVTNAAGTADSATATIAVVAPPFITTQPQSKAIVTGQTTTLTVAATGTGLSFQWYQGASGTVTNPIANATAASFTTPALTVATSYWVQVSNLGGFVNSSTATISVNGLAPTITTQPVSQLAHLGDTVVFTVAATGTAPLSYQWKKGSSTLSGATGASLSLAGVQIGDGGTYSVTVSNTAGTAVSNNATLTVIPAGMAATHALTTAGYSAGGTVTITNTLTYTGATSTVGSVGWSVLLPTGWSYASGAGSEGDVKPTVGATGELDWVWTTTPASPLTFTYTLNVPAGQAGSQTLSALAIVRQSGSLYQFLAQPDPLVIGQILYHSADENQDFKIGLLELTRVVELYNTRNNGNRTGAYIVQAGTEDGFAPDPTRAINATVTLTQYHSADENQDGKLGLLELTRVVELYNYRVNGVRTGDYHPQAGTEDGFAPGS